jgi:hypothetical protein
VKVLRRVLLATALAARTPAAGLLAASFIVACGGGAKETKKPKVAKPKGDTAVVDTKPSSMAIALNSTSAPWM